MPAFTTDNTTIRLDGVVWVTRDDPADVLAEAQLATDSWVEQKRRPFSGYWVTSAIVLVSSITGGIMRHLGVPNWVVIAFSVAALATSYFWYELPVTKRVRTIHELRRTPGVVYIGEHDGPVDEQERQRLLLEYAKAEDSSDTLNA